MGLVATLREVRDSASDGLNRQSDQRPVMVDGSLSEIISRALNIAYSKKDLTSGDPYYGKSRENGEPPMGAGSVPNIMQPDSPKAATIRPSLESQQQDSTIIDSVAAVLADAVDIRDDAATSTFKKPPLIVYAIPTDGMVTEEMNDSIEMRAEGGGYDLRDFAFVHSDSPNPSNGDGMRIVDLNQKISDYEGKGARVFKSLEDFTSGFWEMRQQRHR